MRTFESIAVLSGGLVTVLMIALACAELYREGLVLASIPLIGVIAWREHVFASMRAEVARLRAH